jgi:hypothetical protein
MTEEKTSGRKKYEGARVHVILNERTEKMLSEIQEYIGATSTSEAMRFLINDYHKANIANKDKS